MVDRWRGACEDFCRGVSGSYVHALRGGRVQGLQGGRSQAHHQQPREKDGCRQREWDERNSGNRETDGKAGWQKYRRGSSGVPRHGGMEEFGDFYEMLAVFGGGMRRLLSCSRG